MTGQYFYRVPISVVPEKTLFSKDSSSAYRTNLYHPRSIFLSILDVNFFEDSTSPILDEVSISSNWAF